MKEFKKFFNQTQNIVSEKSIAKEKTFTWGNGDYSMEIGKKPSGELDFSVFFVDNGIEFTMPKKDVNELNNWVIGEDQVTEALSSKVFNRIDSLMDNTKIKKLFDIINDISTEMEEEGIDFNDTVEYIIDKIKENS